MNTRGSLHRRTPFIAAIIAAAFAFAAIPAFSATAAAPPPLAPTPGADGIGDPYYPLAGNGGYDVSHYDLDIGYDPDTDVLTGHVQIDAIATQDLSRFNLDFVGLTVDEVLVQGTPATFTRELDHELVITPAAALPASGAFVVEVTYDGIPHSPTTFGEKSGAVRTDDGVIMIGEPDVAAYWYPSNDHPRDKATFDIDLTVPKGLQAISNGRLLGRVHDGAGHTTWSWQVSSPMATYLATAAVGRFRIEHYETGAGLHVLDAVDTQVSHGNRYLPRQPRIIRLLESNFGPYPFEDVGAIVDRVDVGYALELQTRPFYPAYRTEGPDPWLIVHELAHQWFGDSVALHDWQDIWLNEGFATYAEWLYEEQRYGYPPSEALTDWCRIGPASDFWDLPIGDPGPNNLFDGTVYYRGAMTLQALREQIGDDDFWEVLTTWTGDHAGGNGTTEEFHALAETISGQDLDTFFDEWLFIDKRPALCRTLVDASGATPLPTAPTDGRHRR